MCCIDHFTRYISLTAVETLSAESIINAFDQHFHRYGQTKICESDMGTNYVRAKKQMQNEDDELLSVQDWNKIQNEMKLRGI